jgi:hypothetical protein
MCRFLLEVKVRVGGGKWDVIGEFHCGESHGARSYIEEEGEVTMRDWCWGVRIAS